MYAELWQSGAVSKLLFQSSEGKNSSCLPPLYCSALAGHPSHFSVRLILDEMSYISPISIIRSLAPTLVMMTSVPLGISTLHVVETAPTPPRSNAL